MKQIKTVMRFEFLTFAKSGTFIGMTILMVLVALIGPLVPTVIRVFGEGAFDGFGGERTIAVVDTTWAIPADTLDEFLAPRVVLFQNIDEARAAVGEGLHNYALEITADGGYTLYVTSMGLGVMNLQHQAESLMQYVHRTVLINQLGATQNQLEAIITPDITGGLMAIDTDGQVLPDTIEDYLQNIVYSYAMSFILYIGLLMGGQYLLTGVIREKSTKTMELLITSCRASYMLNGKVFGVGAAILLQLLLMVGAALFSMQIAGLMEVGMLAASGEDLSGMFSGGIPANILVFLPVFFLLGYVMYAYVYAALASTVSRMEDANSIAMLPVLLIVAGLLGSVFGLNNPDAQWIVIMSHVPLFAPFMMFMRICLNMVQGFEIAVSIAAQIATIIAISWLGGRMYRMGTLMYGNKPKIKDLWMAMTAR